MLTMSTLVGTGGSGVGVSVGVGEGVAVAVGVAVSVAVGVAVGVAVDVAVAVSVGAGVNVGTKVGNAPVTLQAETSHAINSSSQPTLGRRLRAVMSRAGSDYVPRQGD